MSCARRWIADSNHSTHPHRRRWTHSARARRAGCCSALHVLRGPQRCGRTLTNFKKTLPPTADSALQGPRAPPPGRAPRTHPSLSPCAAAVGLSERPREGPRVRPPAPLAVLVWRAAHSARAGFSRSQHFCGAAPHQIECEGVCGIWHSQRRCEAACALDVQERHRFLLLLGGGDVELEIEYVAVLDDV